jgi:hypothetical protein
MSRIFRDAAHFLCPPLEFEDPRLEKCETWGTLIGFSHFVLVAYCEAQTWATRLQGYRASYTLTEGQ